MVTGDGPGTGGALVDAADFLSFTGSSATGRAGAARVAGRLVGCSLELGGKNPMIVRADADVDAAVMRAFATLGETVVLPLHPRTRARLEEFGTFERMGGQPENVRLIDPVGYPDMVALEQSARIILTDSGGIQKEAFLLSVPCIMLRPETEWIETVEAGWNVVVDVDGDAIHAAIGSTQWPSPPAPQLYGAGTAGRRIVEFLHTETP